MTETLVLFDIDGTLIHTAGAGLRGMNAAFGRLHRQPDALAGIPFAGRTDRAIVSEALRRIGIEPTPAAIESIRDIYLDHLPEELERRIDGPYGVLPGVEALIDALGRREGTGFGLLTGNFAHGARIKLGHFGLWDRFAFGAFGDEHLDRRDLVPLALTAARAAGHAAAAPRVIVVGDTPLDIDCAHAHGAMALAVATGIYTRDALAAAGADVVVETLADLAASGGREAEAWLRT